jgi:hypothetical protein
LADEICDVQVLLFKTKEIFLKPIASLGLSNHAAKQSSSHLGLTQCIAAEMGALTVMKSSVAFHEQQTSCIAAKMGLDLGYQLANNLGDTRQSKSAASINSSQRISCAMLYGISVVTHTRLNAVSTRNASLHDV